MRDSSDKIPFILCVCVSIKRLHFARKRHLLNPCNGKRERQFGQILLIFFYGISRSVMKTTFCHLPKSAWNQLKKKKKKIGFCFCIKYLDLPRKQLSADPPVGFRQHFFFSYEISIPAKKKKNFLLTPIRRREGVFRQLFFLF